MRSSTYFNKILGFGNYYYSMESKIEKLSATHKKSFFPTGFFNRFPQDIVIEAIHILGNHKEWKNESSRGCGCTSVQSRSLKSERALARRSPVVRRSRSRSYFWVTLPLALTLKLKNSISIELL